MKTMLPDLWHLSQVVQQLLETGATDLDQALLIIKRKDLQDAEEATKRKMIRIGRCPVCTLKLPCKHYTEKSQLPKSHKPQPKSQDQISITISPRMSPQPDPGSPYTPTFAGRYSPHAHSFLTSVSPGPSTVSYRQKKEGRARSQIEARKEESRRLKLIEKLDRYRADRLGREIERLEEMKRREQEEKENELKREKQRQMRQARLKQQLAEHQEKLQTSQQLSQPRFRSHSTTRPIATLPHPSHRKANTRQLVATTDSNSLKTVDCGGEDTLPRANSVAR